jgi:uncharacterized damage-inducible protein DinB
MEMIDEIRQLFAYNRWANRQMLDVAASFSAEELTRELGGSFASLHATLAHMAGAEWVWLKRWQGTSPEAMPVGWENSTLGELRAVWADIEDGQAAFLELLTDGRLKATIRYRTLTGAEYQGPLWQLLRHVVNHATYHRGQVATLTRQLGGVPPSTDLVRFYREGGVDAA